MGKKELTLLERIEVVYGKITAFDGRLAFWANSVPHDVRDVARRLRADVGDVCDCMPVFEAPKRGRRSAAVSEPLDGEMFNGATSLKRAVDVYGKVLKAHTHSPEQFTKVAPVDQPEKHRGWTSPILGMVNPHYLRNKPTAWSNGGYPRRNPRRNSRCFPPRTY